ncbi:MAG TPA: LuxR C-terminal-related transcriptional regulator, partial [Baekduia sp.]|nr:LuxR C-terminal-related transcriptional regulator [Baekduia sp.]
DFYRHVDVEAMVGFMLPSRPPVTIGIGLFRAEGDFDDDEVTLLAAARPHLIRAYRTVELSSARRATIAALEAGLETLGSAVLVVDGAGRIELATPSARRLLAGRLGARTGRLAPDVVARLAERRAAGTPATEPLVLDDEDGGRLFLRVLAGPEGNTDMLVVEPGSSGLSVVALQALGLTRREAEALRWIALGRRGPQVAELMGISPRTVETHLQNAYAKLDVRTAADAAATVWAAVGVRLPEL